MAFQFVICRVSGESKQVIVHGSYIIVDRLVVVIQYYKNIAFACTCIV